MHQNMDHEDTLAYMSACVMQTRSVVFFVVFFPQQGTGKFLRCCLHFALIQNHNKQPSEEHSTAWCAQTHTHTRSCVTLNSSVFLFPDVEMLKSSDEGVVAVKKTDRRPFWTVVLAPLCSCCNYSSDAKVTAKSQHVATVFCSFILGCQSSISIQMHH